MVSDMYTKKDLDHKISLAHRKYNVIEKVKYIHMIYERVKNINGI